MGHFGENWICDCYLIHQRDDKKCYTCLTTRGNSYKKFPDDIGLGYVIKDYSLTSTPAEELERQLRLKKIKEQFNVLAVVNVNKETNESTNIQSDSSVQQLRVQDGSGSPQGNTGPRDAVPSV